jgi:hypothetical protein
MATTAFDAELRNLANLEMLLNIAKDEKEAMESKLYYASLNVLSLQQRIKMSIDTLYDMTSRDNTDNNDILENTDNNDESNDNSNDDNSNVYAKEYYYDEPKVRSSFPKRSTKKKTKKDNTKTQEFKRMTRSNKYDRLCKQPL